MRGCFDVGKRWRAQVLRWSARFGGLSCRFAADKVQVLLLQEFKSKMDDPHPRGADMDSDRHRAASHPAIRGGPSAIALRVYSAAAQIKRSAVRM